MRLANLLVFSNQSNSILSYRVMCFIFAMMTTVSKIRIAKYNTYALNFDLT